MVVVAVVVVVVDAVVVVVVVAEMLLIASAFDAVLVAVDVAAEADDAVVAVAHTVLSIVAGVSVEAGVVLEHFFNTFQLFQY